MHSRQRGGVLLLYVFEDLLMEDPHYSPRHFDFIKQSIDDLNTQLKPLNCKVLSANGSVVKVLESISKNFRIEKIRAHQETGVMTTYKRDLEVTRWCEENKNSFCRTPPTRGL